MTALHDKINSYALERGIEMADAPNGIGSPISQYPATTGTNIQGISFTIIGSILASADGPAGGGGCYKLRTKNARAALYQASTNIKDFTGIDDNNYTYGVWMKIEQNPTRDMYLTRFSAYGFMFSISSSREIFITTSDGTYYTGTYMIPGQWHYFAIINVDGGNSKFYLDGSFVYNLTNYNAGNGSTVYLGTYASAAYGTDMYMSNVHFAPTSVLDATAIYEIWQVGSGGVQPGDVLIEETPATASAEMLEPLIAVTSGDHVEITTSIIVSAVMTDAAVYASKFVNILAEAMDPTAIFANPALIIGNSIFISPGVMSGNALMTQNSTVSREPFIASAEMGQATSYVTPNYFNIINQKSPVIYCQFDSTTDFVNDGSWAIDSTSIGATVSKTNNSPAQMALVGAGNSWKSNGTYNNAPNFVSFVVNDGINKLYDLVQSKNWTVEFWMYPTQDAGVKTSLPGFEIGYYAPQNTMFVNMTETLPLWNIDGDPVPNDSGDRFMIGTPNAITVNQWNYVSVKMSNNTVTLYINNSTAATLSITLDTWASTQDSISISMDSDADSKYDVGSNRGWVYEDDSYSLANCYIDQFAIYDTALTFSDMIDRYSFVMSLDSDVDHTAAIATATATSGNHQFAVTNNVVYPQTSATAFINSVDPTVSAGRSINFVATTNTSPTVSMVDPSIYYGATITANAITAYGDIKNASVLDQTYRDYIFANHSPYRYASFDTADSLFDSGSDSDYAVPNISFTGTIVTPEFGINNKSAKTAGFNYATDGVIFLESEYDDTWGTGTGEYHSAFWIKQSEDDVSTGLRVLWNLNGAFDNQHVVVYQYLNKLHMNFNNGSGTYIDVETTLGYNLFDGERHFVAINFNHNGSNGLVDLYIDGLLTLSADLGSYNGQTINSDTYLAPNDPANNFPRLSIGGLITPFVETSLPVVPTNFKAYIDEPYWSKTGIDQTAAIGIYSTMPDTSNTIVIAEINDVSAEMIAPTSSASQKLPATATTASAEMTDIIDVYTEYNNVIAVQPMDASATIVDSIKVGYVLIYADVAIASAYTPDSTVGKTIPGGPMIANVGLLNNYVNGITLTTNTFSTPLSIYDIASPWVAWLRSTNIGGIYPTKEVA